MTAPESVVRAVQDALGCERGDTTGRCQRHAVAWHPAYPCPTAQDAADAAWAVAYPAALRDAAENLHLVAEVMATTALSVADARETLRSWADESETTATEESL